MRLNRIKYERDISRKLPDDVAATWDIVRNSLKIDSDRDITTIMSNLVRIQQSGGLGPKGFNLLEGALFPYPEGIGTPLHITKMMPILQEVVPDKDEDRPVAIPFPDITYGYDIFSAFEDMDQHQDVLLRYPGLILAEHNCTETFPMLFIEFKKYHPIWQASNQCLGDAAAGINLVKRFNEYLQDKSCTSRIQTTVFSIAINVYEAVLHVSWEEDGEYIMKDLDYFHLRRKDEVLRLAAHVQSIFKWAEGQRLDEIKGALDEFVSKLCNLDT